MFKFSEHGIKDQNLFCMMYADFIKWCMEKATQGTFSTYMDGEPVFFSSGAEVSYRQYKSSI